MGDLDRHLRTEALGERLRLGGLERRGSAREVAVMASSSVEPTGKVCENSLDASARRMF